MTVRLNAGDDMEKIKANLQKAGIQVKNHELNPGKKEIVSTINKQVEKTYKKKGPAVIQEYVE